MRKLLFFIIFLILSLVFGLTPAKEENEKLVTIQAQVSYYSANAIRLDFEDNVTEWKDAIHMKIVAPQKWEGREIEIFCPKEPDNSMWRKIGNTYEFSIPEKYLIGTYQQDNVRHIPNLGDIQYLTILFLLSREVMFFRKDH